MDGPDQDGTQHEIECLRRALDQASVDFEEFVSTAAHNLRESLRDVSSFSQLMAETENGRLDSDSRGFLDHILEGAAGMQSLLTDMVEYSAAGTGDRHSSRTDMEAVVVQTLLCMEKQIAERGAIVTHDPMPPVSGDFGRLAKVLNHLIRNAIQYCDMPSPRVHISCRRDGLEWVFAVQDSGPGIDPVFQGRIFGVFKRLHGKDRPGNGLGLAFCKKAVEWHGGRIWVASTPGTGSTFYFTLPPAD